MKPIKEAWFCNIDITSKCFMTCLYCSRYTKHLRDDQKYDMTLEVFEKTLDTLKNWPNRIGIIGGEPIMHDQFEEICYDFKKDIWIKYVAPQIDAHGCSGKIEVK